MTTVLRCAFVVALLAGCSILPEKTAISLFAPDPRIQADPAWPTVAWQLVVPRPVGPALVDSARIPATATRSHSRRYRCRILSSGTWVVKLKSFFSRLMPCAQV